jgi:uncharacterized protein YdhG (YjbR/CyaY superfamily)
MDEFEEFVQRRVSPQFQDIVRMIRNLMRECAPEAREHMSYGVPNWSGRRGLAVISPTKKDITFAFSNGAYFVDDYGLLQGVGKRSKHVKISRLDEVNYDALRDYIRQALEHDVAKTKPGS